MRARRAGHAALLLLALMLLLVCQGALGQDRGITEPTTTQALSRKHKHHHLLLFMGGLKSLAALVLIKIKIVLVVAAIVAVAVFTIKYLLGASDLAALLHKAPLPPQPPPPPPPYLHEVVHEPVYGHGPTPHHHHHHAGPEYATPIPWEHTNHEYEGYITDWSKYGDGGRSLLEISSLSPSLGKILLQNSFNHKRNKIK